MSFPERLRLLRTKREKSREDIAKIVDLSWHTVAKWETGKRDPDTTAILRLADYFQVSTDYLLGKVANPHDELVPEKKQTPADTAGENIGLPAELHQRVISALDNMDPERADEIVQRIESAAALFPKEPKDAPAKKMA